MLRIIIGVAFCLFFSQVSADTKYYPSEDIDVQEYLQRMPWKYYKQYHVPWLGNFWVDDAYDVVKDTIKSGKIWETYIIDILKKYLRPGDRAMDIGSHMGSITFAMSNLVGPKGKVYAFEAERQFFRELIENIKLNNKANIFPHLCWVSDENKIVPVTYFYGSAYSPVHSPDDKEYNLNIRTLDSFGYEDIKLMKIDVECTEDQVLDGARNTILKCKPILIIEIMGGYGHDNSTVVRNRIKNTIEKLEALGYEVSKIWVDDYLCLPRSGR